MTIRAPAFLSRSQPPSPSPIRPASFAAADDSEATANTPTHTRRALARLQKTFKRASLPSPTPVSSVPFPSGLTPLEPASSLPGQYLDTVGLRFAEAASKALANPTGPSSSSAYASGAILPAKNDPCIQLLKGQKPLPPGRGAALGTLITSELAKSNDLHVSRAVIRTLQRPLSVLLNRISAMLMPLLPYATQNSTEVSSLGTVSLLAQAHALGIVRMAAELLEALNGVNQSVILGSGGVDHLRGIREGLEIILKRVVEPLISSVNSEVGPILDTLAVAPPSSDVDAQAVNCVLSLSAALPGITTRLEWYTALPGAVAQSANAALLIGLVWRALVALSCRPLHDPFAVPLPTMKKPGSREGIKDATVKEKQTTPGLKTKELPFVNALSRGWCASPASQAAPACNAAVSSNGVVPDPNGTTAGQPRVSSRTPPSTPRFGRRALPLTSLSRPPSPASKGAQPPPALTPLERLLADTAAVQAMLGMLSKPSQGGLALEAVNEAFDALEGFKNMLQWLVEEIAPFSASRDKRSLQTITTSLLRVSEYCPALIALSVIVQLVPPAQLPRQCSSMEASLLASAESIISSEWQAITISELLGMQEVEYRSSCLTGFGRADAAVEPVGRALLSVFQPSINADEFSCLVWEKGVDLRVLQGWLAERIISIDHANFTGLAADDKEPNLYGTPPHSGDIDEQVAGRRSMRA
jgi:hypothetical protein